MGTHVTSIRKTLKGDLQVEITKCAKATAATSVIHDQLSTKMPGSKITRLRHTSEITDLDEVTTKKVLSAIHKVINGGEPFVNDEGKVTRLWVTQDGGQMATTTVPISDSQKIISICVGWTQCQVQQRRLEPARCYKCHGFGHLHACRRCGKNGHRMRRHESCPRTTPRFHCSPSKSGDWLG